MFRTLTLLSAAVLTLTGSQTAQETCKKTISESPVLFGLKLGLSTQELPPILGPASKFKPKKSGEGSFFQNFIDRPATGSLMGVRAFFVRYANNSVYQIEIFYDDKEGSAKLDDFIASLSAKHELPLTAWEVKNGRATLDCGDFLITADTLLNRHIELTDKSAFKQFQDKKRAVSSPTVREGLRSTR